MSRPPGLVAYLSLAALGASTARRRIAGEIARGGAEAARLSERLGQPSQRRPDGRLIWLHACAVVQEKPLLDLAERIADSHPDASFLLTTDASLTLDTDLPPYVIHQYVPHEASAPVRAFLDHWRPDIALWAGTSLRPALIHEAVSRGTMLHLVDAAGAPDAIRGWKGWSGLARATLRGFETILATDDAAAEELAEAGADPDAIVVAGPLEEEAATLPYNLRERDAIGAILKARPVWLANSVTEAEEEIVIAAHQKAVRQAHKLLLILVPADPNRGPELANRLAAQGLTVARRSVEGEPDASTEVFVADSEGELGLWYRLAPITFMGGTMDPDEDGGRSPLEPAALGSAILHGPMLGRNKAVYGRFWSAHAARGTTDADSLGAALSELLSPDKAATMAHAAWRISTGGADMNERVLALVADGLAKRAAG